MEKVLIILSINVCLISVFVKSAYHVQYFHQQNTWFEAQSHCHDLGGSLATHDINYVNCSEVTGVDSTKVSTFWTGEYSMTSHWISKIGCIEILGQPNTSVARTVSRCLEICKMRHVNVEFLAHIESRCVCISSKVPSFRKIIDVHQCSNTIVSNNRYWEFSVTRNKTLTGPGNCVFVNCMRGPVLYTSKCLDERRPFCNSTALLNWTMSQKHCNDKIPGQLWDICHTMPTEQKGAWLPINRVILRTDVRQDMKFKEEAVTGCASTRCNYKKGVSTKFQASTPCKEKTDGFFCTLYETNASNNSSLLYSRTYNHRTSKAPERTVNALEITGMLQSSISTVEQQIDNMNLPETHERHATFKIGLIVGGALGALVVIGLIVLVVIFKFRRTKDTTKMKHNEQLTINNGDSISYEDKHRKKLSSNEKVNQIYEDDWAHSGGLYAGETMDTYIINAQTTKKPNDLYAVVMKDNMTPQMHAGFDSVEAQEEAFESEYDRLNITPTVLTENMENNLYDSSIGDRCESDPTYNTATNIIHSRQNNEDVYDRI